VSRATLVVAMAAVALGVWAVAVTAAPGHRARAAATSCSSSTVHYEAGSAGARSGVPWLKLGRRGHAYLSYYHAVLADARVNQSPGAVIYTRSGTAPVPMKVLWMVDGSGPRAVLTGTRLDAPGNFTERLRGVGGFASVVRVPAAGCWKLTVHAGRGRASVIMEAVYPRSTFSCDATPIRRDAPDPIGADIPWLLTTPASAGITGTIFYHVPTDVTHAVIYPNKQTPDNGNTKILWKVPAKTVGSWLTVLASRLDAPAVMPPQRFSAASDSSPGVSFPSGIDVSSTGCWLLTVRSGRAAGIVVVQSIPRS
jgi:hypothetical protein